MTIAIDSSDACPLGLDGSLDVQFYLETSTRRLLTNLLLWVREQLCLGCRSLTSAPESYCFPTSGSATYLLPS